MSVEPGEENTAEQSAAEPKRPARKPAARTPAARKPAARKPAARKPAARKPAATPEPEAQVPPVPIVPAELAAIAFTVPPLPPLPEPEPVPEPEPEPAAEPGPEPEPEPEPELKSAPVAAETASVPVHPFAVRLRELVKTYGDEAAVDGIDLTIPTGSVYALVGPNGAGKTTTLSAISGLLTPDRGRVEIHGVDLAASPRAAKALLGVLPDRLRTFDRLTGRQLLFTYGALRGMDRPVIAERTEDLARAFDLGDALNRPVADYSAGMTKKVMLAGALIHAPRVLILDEPFEAVDPLSSAVILDILQTYVDHGGTVVLSTHGMDVVERFCTHIAVLVDGRIIADGTVDEVRAGRSLPERFVELAGGIDEVEGLEWLHTFSA